VGAGTGSPVDLPADVFEAQMRELRDSGRIVALGDCLAALESGEPFADDRVAVTFDDAFENFDSVARPVLERLGIPATLFVPTDFVDGRAPGPLAGAEDLPPVGWKRLAEWAAGGSVEIGSHSRSHPDLRSLDDEALEQEIAGSAARIRERVGVEPAVF
jgi:peptidoglycan/xylan/chitin deacetylase (PgdA/CDA1 family)